MTPQLILVAHGTRDPRGAQAIASLAQEVAEYLPEVRVRTAFIDVLGPSLGELLRDSAAPTVVVPAFLAPGYHVHQDIPREIATSGHRRVTVTPTLGPDPVIAQVMAEKLRESGWRPGDRVILAATGSSDPQARADVTRAATLLQTHLDTPVTLGWLATGQPRVSDLVTAAPTRVFLASYLLAPGLFHRRLLQLNATATTTPIGSHPAIAQLLAERYRAAQQGESLAAPARPGLRCGPNCRGATIGC